MYILSRTGFFFDIDDENVKVFGTDGVCEKRVKTTVLDCVKEGRAMLQQKFASKMYTYYAEWRDRPM